MNTLDLSGPILDAIESILKFALPFLAIGAGVALLAVLRRRLRSNRLRSKLRKLEMPEIDCLSGKDFEWLLREVYLSQGARCILTSYRGDWGADLVFEKNGIKTVVQAKRSRKRVGVRAVQEVVAAKAKYGATDAVVVTNSTFTDAAIELAKVNRVRLRSRTDLEKMVTDMKVTAERGKAA